MNGICLVAENIEAQGLYVKQCGKNPHIQVRKFPWHLLQKENDILKKLCPEGLLTAEIPPVRVPISKTPHWSLLTASNF